MMNQNHFTNINIPQNWSGAQAKTVIDFLEEIVQSIWLTYEIAIQKEQEIQVLQLVKENLDDDFPF